MTVCDVLGVSTRVTVLRSWLLSELMWIHHVCIWGRQPYSQVDGCCGKVPRYGAAPFSDVTMRSSKSVLVTATFVFRKE